MFFILCYFYFIIFVFLNFCSYFEFFILIMISEESAANTFSKIMEEGNALLEATIIEEVLQLRLTVSESANKKDIYVGEIRNMEEHEKLK